MVLLLLVHSSGKRCPTEHQGGRYGETLATYPQQCELVALDRVFFSLSLCLCLDLSCLLISFVMTCPRYPCARPTAPSISTPYVRLACPGPNRCAGTISSRRSRLFLAPSVILATSCSAQSNSVEVFRAPFVDPEETRSNRTRRGFNPESALKPVCHPSTSCISARKQVYRSSYKYQVAAGSRFTSPPGPCRVFIKFPKSSTYVLHFYMPCYDRPHLVPR